MFNTIKNLLGFKSPEVTKEPPAPVVVQEVKETKKAKKPRAKKAKK